MVTDTVLGAAIGVSGAVVGSLLTGAFSWYSTKQQIEAANHRRRAEFVAERKVDELMRLSSEIENTHGNIMDCLTAIDGDNEPELDEFVESPIKLKEQMRAAGLFLDNDQIYTMSDYYSEVLIAEAYIMKESGKNLDEIEEKYGSFSILPEDLNLSQQASEFDLVKYKKEYGNVTNMLRGEVAEPIEKLQ